jgi:acyl-coenzyme A thioesterase PaaI-like protein
VNQRNQAAGVGAWSKINEREYRYTFTRFRFDASGGFTGWVTAHEAVMLDDERSAFDAEVRLQTFDPQGHLVASASGTIKGTRIEP